MPGMAGAYYAQTYVRILTASVSEVNALGPCFEAKNRRFAEKYRCAGSAARDPWAENATPPERIVTLASVGADAERSDANGGG